MKLEEKNLKLINEELENWKKETDKYKDLKDIPLSNFKREHHRDAELNKWKEKLYFIMNGDKIMISAGTLMWLFLYGQKNEVYVASKYNLRNYPQNVLEEFKMAHRLKLLNLTLQDFDYNEINRLIEEK